MTTIQKLPYEILLQIFRSVRPPSTYRNNARNHNRDLLNCASVCHSWYLPACRVLYEEINVFSIQRLNKCFEIQGRNLGAFCKEILLNGWRFDEEQFAFEQFDQLFTYLPNIQKVIVGSTSTRDYLHYLMRSAEKIKNLRELDLMVVGHSLDTTLAYHECALTFKETLRHIKLTVPVAPVLGNNGMIRPMYTFLPTFTALTSLYVKNLLDGGSGELSMFDIIHLCPNLVKLNWFNEFKEHDVDESKCQFDHKNLKSLDTVSFETTKQHVDRIGKNITGLKQLRVYIGSYNKRLSRRVYNLNQLHYWEPYLSGIERVDFSIKDYFPTTFNDFWPLIDSMNGSSPSIPTHISMEIAYPYNSRTPPRINIKLHKFAKGTSFHSQIISEELNLDKHIISPIGMHSAILFTNFSSKRMIQSYEVYCSPSDHDMETINKCLLNVLEPALECFPNMCYFNVISCYPYDTRKYRIVFQITAVSDETDYYKDYSVKSNMIKSNPKRNTSDPSKKLAYVKIKNMQSLKDIDTTLKLLPNTQYLTLLGMNVLDKNSNVTLNLGTLNLRHLYLDITKLPISPTGKHTMVLQIEEKANSQKHCYKWERKSGRFTEIIFEPVSVNFSKQYGRFLSINYTIITIQVNRIEQIVLGFEPSHCKNPIQTTINLTPQ